MVMIDVFRSDPFSTVQLTRVVERTPYQPDMLGQMGIFEPVPSRTLDVAVEDRDGVLTIIPFSEVGAPPTERTNEKRNIRTFRVPRLATADTITAVEIAGVRDFGEETALVQMQQEVARRLSGPTGLTRNIEYTWERHRLGAIQGKVLDADNTEKFNWFTTFGVSEPAEIAFDLANTSPARKLRVICNEVTRGMRRAAKGAFTNRTRIVGLCGDEFWDKLTTHPDVEKTYLNWLAAQELRQGTAWQSLSFGDIDWVNYRGSDDNSTIAIATDKVRFFPVNAPGVFQVAHAPAEFMPWVNTLGKPMYVIPIFDKDRGAWWKMEVYSYPLHICTRPEVLYRGKAGAPG